MAKHGWLHHVPPLRFRPRRHRHYELHDLVGSWIVYALAGTIWIYEAAIWATVWFYYGLFLGVRALVRQIAAASSARATARRGNLGS